MGFLNHQQYIIQLLVAFFRFLLCIVPTNRRFVSRGAKKRGPTGLFTGAGVGDAAVSTGSGEGPGRRPQRFMEAKFGGGS